MNNESLTAILRSVALLLTAAIAAPAWAADEETDNFQVTMTILDSCTVAADNLDFGSVNALGSAVDTDTTITVNCSVDTAYSVSLDQGLNGTRLMSDGSDTIDYDLYTSAARDSAWGVNVGTDTVDGTGLGSDQVITVYGRVPAQTTPAPAAYQDTVMATIAF